MSFRHLQRARRIGRDAVVPLVGFAAIFFAAAHCAAVNDVAGDLVVFSDNGAWSWFEYERAIVDTSAGKIVVSSVANASGTGGAARHGDVEVASLDLATGTVSRFTLSDALTAFEPISGVFGDLNSDGALDLSDFTLFLSGLHTDLSGLTPEQAFMKGDLNGDLSNDFDDFVLFRQAYDIAHGAGAFAALGISLPEPSGWALLTLGGVLRGCHWLRQCSARDSLVHSSSVRVSN